MNKKDKFIEKSIKTHGDKYDYSSVEYVDNKTDVEIFCKKCNEHFKQRPYHHYNGRGCQKCGKNKKLDNFEFIKRANEKHLNKFDYSLVEYKNMHTEVKIICKTHDVFEQTPMNHLHKGCYKCNIHKKSNTKEFIEKSIKIHGDKYDYSLVEYINSKTKVKIICNYHNYIFKQTPSDHTKHNCPLCGNKNRRLSRIKEISINKFNGNQIIPSFSYSACELFDRINEEKDIHIQHAMNGGEFYIEELGYWLDGYDKKNNTAYEFDEKHHFDKNGNLSEKDLIRQHEIEDFLKCSFIRIKYDQLFILEKRDLL